MLTVLLVAADGDDEGRRGNALYEQGNYAAAAEVYREGLAQLPEAQAGVVLSGLHNNLGSALYQEGEYEAARESFARALRTADAPADRVRASYNGGNTSYRLDDLETALAFYRDALLEDPTQEDARFNYEYVKRQLQQQQQQQQQGDQQQDDQQQQQDQDGEQEQQDQQGQDQEGGDQDGDQQGDQQDPESEQEQPGENQPQDGQEPEPNPEGEPQQPQPQDPTQLSQAEAERILQAMQNDEAELLREVMKMDARPRRVEKDW